MITKQVTVYQCQHCGEEYVTAESATACEASHKVMTTIQGQQFEPFGKSPFCVSLQSSDTTKIYRFVFKDEIDAPVEAP